MLLLVVKFVDLLSVQWVKAFNIPHPTKDGKRLWHGCLEGPEYAVYVRGRLTGDDSITLPDYWSELVHEDTITVQLQPIGVNQDIVVKEWNLEKVVLSSLTSIDCFYTITGTRKDVPLLEVEQDPWRIFPCMVEYWNKRVLTVCLMIICPVVL